MRGGKYILNPRQKRSSRLIRPVWRRFQPCASESSQMASDRVFTRLWAILAPVFYTLRCAVFLERGKCAGTPSARIRQLYARALRLIVGTRCPVLQKAVLLLPVPYAHRGLPRAASAHRQAKGLASTPSRHNTFKTMSDTQCPVCLSPARILSPQPPGADSTHYSCERGEFKVAHSANFDRYSSEDRMKLQTWLQEKRKTTPVPMIYSWTLETVMGPRPR